jgi:hypothetical protein
MARIARNYMAPYFWKYVGDDVEVVLAVIVRWRVVLSMECD